MTKLNSRNKFFWILGLGVFFLSSAPWGFALLQGNQVRFIGEDAEAPPTSPREFNYDLDESAPDEYLWLILGKKDLAKKTIEPFDLTLMNYLSFWIKIDSSDGQPIHLSIELHEDTNHDKKFTLNPDVASRVSVGKFSSSEAGKEWKKITVPLSQFRGIRYRDRLLEIGLVLEIKKAKAKGKLLIDRLLFGLNYPEGIQGEEIHMQNRVSSFKIGNRVANSQMLLKRKTTPLVLTLTFVDPYLEMIRFEESEDGGGSWHTLGSFYDHKQGGVYKLDWNPSSGPQGQQGVLIRAVGMNVLGGEAELAGPYHVDFN